MTRDEALDHYCPGVDALLAAPWVPWERANYKGVILPGQDDPDTARWVAQHYRDKGWHVLAIADGGVYGHPLQLELHFRYRGWETQVPA